MIIDFHTHAFPASMAKKILPEVRERAKIEYYTDGTIDGLIQSMNKARIDISAVSRITSKPEHVESIHTWLQDIKSSNTIPMTTWTPGLPVDHERILELKKSGFRCMKLHPDYQGFFVDDNKMFPLYEFLQEANIPLLLHAGLDRGLPPPVHASPEQIIAVCNAFPELCIIAAHMGGEDNYEETEKYLLGTDIYLDTSFVLRIMPENTLKRFLSKHPVERILFGSDSPWTDQKKELEYLLSLPFLNDNAKEMITGRNAALLLEIDD